MEALARLGNPGSSGCAIRHPLTVPFVSGDTATAAAAFRHMSWACSSSAWACTCWPIQRILRLLVLDPVDGTWSESAARGSAKSSLAGYRWRRIVFVRLSIASTLLPQASY
jgi:hypothetical protein